MKLRVLLPKTWGIGNSSVEIYYALLRAYRENSRLLLILPARLPRPLGPRRIDPGIYDIRSPMLLVAPTAWMLLPIRAVVSLGAMFPYVLGRLLSRLGMAISDHWSLAATGTLDLWAPSRSVSSFTWEQVDAMGWREAYEVDLPVRLSQRCEAEFESWKCKVEMPSETRYVVLHVREAGFHMDDHVGNARNANPKNYEEAIDYLLQTGRWVVRIGDPSMTPLRRRPGFVDLTSQAQVPGCLMAALIAKCDFYIGMQSGPMDTARLWQKPRLLLNLYTAAFPAAFLPSDVGVYKHFFREGLQVGPEATLWSSDQDRRPDFSLRSLTYAELSSSEIVQSVREFIESERPNPKGYDGYSGAPHWRNRLREFIEATTFSDVSRSNLEYKYLLASRIP